MKISSVLMILGPILGLLAGIAIERQLLNSDDMMLDSNETAIEHASKHLDPTYVCPMHPEIISDEEGSCPICGMDLVKAKQSKSSDIEDEKHPVVTVSPAVMNSLGVRTVKLTKGDISRRVETPGFVQQIKKGKEITYRAPFDGVIDEFLYQYDYWYENAGEPLIRLTSETLLEAQKQHLQIFMSATPESKQHRAEPVDNDNDAVAIEKALNNTQPDSFLDKDGRLTDEYRDQLLAMGHNAASIAELEKEMQKTLSKPAEKTEENTKPDETLTNKESTSADESSASNDESEETMTLADSRKHLRSLGMRDLDIKKLEETGEATDKLTLYSNGEGRVMSMKLEQGAEVRKGEKLFKFGGNARAVVVANAFQRDAAWITTGQRVEIRLPHDKSVVWPGIVNQGAISIDPDSQNIGIRLSFTAPLDKIKSNMYVMGTIFGHTRKDIISVPTQSIIRTEGEDRVIMALGDGRFKPVTVTLGAEAGGRTEITEGLAEGDEIVVMAQFLIDSESSLQASLQRLNSQ